MAMCTSVCGFLEHSFTEDVVGTTSVSQAAEVPISSTCMQLPITLPGADRLQLFVLFLSCSRPRGGQCQLQGGTQGRHGVPDLSSLTRGLRSVAASEFPDEMTISSTLYRTLHMINTGK